MRKKENNEIEENDRKDLYRGRNERRKSVANRGEKGERKTFNSRRQKLRRESEMFTMFILMFDSGIKCSLLPQPIDSISHGLLQG